MLLIRTGQGENTTAHEATKGVGPGILLFAEVHHCAGEESVGGRSGSYNSQLAFHNTVISWLRA